MNASVDIYAVVTYCKGMNKIIISKKAQKLIKQIPRHVSNKLKLWIKDVEKYGIGEVRKIPGYNDKPLSGGRKNQRSVRLSRAYRGFYIEYKEIIEKETIDIVNIIEVNNHDY